MQTAFKGINFNIEFQGETKIIGSAGRTLLVATVKNTSSNGTFMQKIYMATKNGYAAELFYTYQNDADLSVLNSIVSTMKIK